MLFSYCFVGTLYIKQIISLSEIIIPFFSPLGCFCILTGDFCNPESFLLALCILSSSMPVFILVHLSRLLSPFLCVGTLAQAFRPDSNIAELDPQSPEQVLSPLLAAPFICCHVSTCYAVLFLKIHLPWWLRR